jgi:hypothetical protein
MTKLLITEITRMGPAHCVIGLARSQPVIQSIRPLPANGRGWSHFPYRRGDVLECSLASLPGAKPHVEDRVLTRGFQKVAEVSQKPTVELLRQAEVAEDLSGLFGCSVQENRSGSGLFVLPAAPSRSICGCETGSLRLELCAHELRATLSLPSGEVLRDLPVVDHEWRGFVESALAPSRGANRLARLERFFNSQFHYKILSCGYHFIRLGLTRPYREVCWLMLDSLFPLPCPEWLEEF